MTRSTGSFDRFASVNAVLVASTMLVGVLSCFDSTAPAVDRAAADGVISVNIVVPDSLKSAPLPQSSVALFQAPPSSSVSGFAPSTSNLSNAVAGHPTYALSHVAFSPEAVPSIAPTQLTDDGFQADVPIGFSFTFYGNTYTKVAIYSNGFLMLGPATMQGFWSGDLIPFTGNPNNIIALAWTDWKPDLAPGSIRYETRGTAPNRRFIAQFVNVPEYLGSGHLNSQVVLSEGSNDITIYTTAMNITRGDLHKVTQGIENAAGTEAALDSVQNPVNGVWSMRAKNVFSLSNDAIRFSIWHENLPPSITPPSNLLVNTDPAPVAAMAAASTRLAVRVGPGLCTALVNPGTPTVTDDAAGTSVVGVRSDGQPLNATYPKGVTTITWTATDAGGLTATSTQTVTVVDKEQPIITAPASISTRTDRGLPTATVAAGTATAVDNCPNAAVGGARSDGLPLSAVFSVGVTTITWTATDESGNSSTAQQTVNVVGNVAPVLTTPPNIAANTDPGVCSAMVSPGTATATDDAPGTVVLGVRNDGKQLNASYPKGITTIAWTATDADGLTATSSQNVVVSDKQVPSITAPQNISTRTDRGAITATVAVGTAAASDNCQQVDIVGTRSDGVALSSPYPVGYTTITWRATDASGNSATAAQTINVVGNVAPVLSAPPSLSVNTDPGVCSALVNVGTATATDDTEGTVVVGTRSDAAPLNAAYPKGVTTIRWLATDIDGATASATRTVTVSDKENPSIAAAADMSVNNDPGLGIASVAVSRPTARDNCPNVTVNGARSDGAAMSAPYPVGRTVITWTATDESGNSSTAQQTITVRDNEPPVIVVPADFAVDATMPSGAVVSYLWSATDNVRVSSASCSPAAGSVFAIGRTRVTCVARDDAGNEATATFFVTVRGVPEQLDNLIAKVERLNLPNGVANPMLAQLRTAQRDPGSNSPHVACVKMSDFINMVQANKGGLISSSKAAELIGDAQRIMTVMPCGSTAPLFPITSSPTNRSVRR